MNSNGMPDLVELLSKMINDKENSNNKNNYYNNSNNNFDNVNSIETNNTNPQISQKYIKGVGNVFAPKIVISDDDNNL